MISTLSVTSKVFATFLASLLILFGIYIYGIYIYVYQTNYDDILEKQSCLKYTFGMLGNWTEKETFFDFYVESIAFTIKILINITLF